MNILRIALFTIVTNIIFISISIFTIFSIVKITQFLERPHKNWVNNLAEGVTVILFLGLVLFTSNRGISFYDLLEFGGNSIHSPTLKLFIFTAFFAVFIIFLFSIATTIIRAVKAVWDHFRHGRNDYVTWHKHKEV